MCDDCTSEYCRLACYIGCELFPPASGDIVGRYLHRYTCRRRKGLVRRVQFGSSPVVVISSNNVSWLDDVRQFSDFQLGFGHRSNIP